MVHKFKFENNNFVLDVNSGKIYIVDDVTYDIIDFIPNTFFDYTESYVIKKLEDKYPVESIKEAYGELVALYNKGLLFTDDPYSHMAINQVNASPIKAICLNVSHDCNLRCEYCFASKGDFKCPRELMSFETAKNAVDFLVKNSANVRNLEMDFFGGEPLMNFEVVKKTVEYARSLEKSHNKNFRFTITTNGLLLDDDKIDFINKEMYDVVLSMDGRKEIHDKFRLTKNKTGSYDIIIPKFKKLVEKRGNKQYYIRGTYTQKNLDFSKDVLHIHQLGFSEISMEPAFFQEGFEDSITEKNLDSILKEHDTLCKKLIELKKQGEKLNFFNFKIDLENGPCISKRLKGCGMGNEYVAIAPNGNIYPCHQLVGEDEFLMGNVNQDSFSKESQEQFLKLNVYHKRACKDCWAKFYCCGGCGAKNYHYNGNLKVPFELSCEIQKKRIECAIIYNILSKDNLA